MTTTTVGKSVPTAAFSLVEMDTPESIKSGEAFNVKVRFTGDPSNPLWQLAKDLGTVKHEIEVFAETVGPGTDLSLHSQNADFDSNKDAYDVDITIPAGKLTVLGLYEIGAVITFTRPGANPGDPRIVIKGLSAFASHAAMQVSSNS